MRRGVAAQRRDRARSERFRAALRELPLRSPGSVASSGSPGRPGAPAAPLPLARAQSDGVPDRPDEPHPPAGDRSSGPWTTGRWTVDGEPSDMRRLGRAVAASALLRSASVDLREAAAGPVVDDTGGAKVLPVPDDPLPPDRAAAGDAGFDPLFGPLDSLVESGVDDGPSGEETVTQANPQPETATAATTPKPSPYDRDGWLANALAELDRAWGAPLPGLGAVRDSLRTAETSHADAPSSADELPDAHPTPLPGDHGKPDDDLFADAGLDEQEASPWASWTDARVTPQTADGLPGSEPRGAHRRGADDPADSHDERRPVGDAAPKRRRRSGGQPRRAHPVVTGAPSDAADPAGSRDGPAVGGVAAPSDVADAPGPGVVGCVVVVDLVCAGEPVTAGAALLRGVMERLADQIPAGSRLRLDDAGSALSVILPEQDRTGACDWMHRTLPAVFRGTAAPSEPVLPVGTALRATVHDTDGPVGAQLLQRLDRARRGDAPSVRRQVGRADRGGQRRAAQAAGWRERAVRAPGRSAHLPREAGRHERCLPSREMGSAPAEPGCRGRAVRGHRAPEPGRPRVRARAAPEGSERCRDGRIARRHRGR